MKRKLFFWILMMAVVTNGACRKMITFDDLTLSKTPYTGDQLRIDGYFYEVWNTEYELFSVYFLYNNGVILYAGNSFADDHVVIDKNSFYYNKTGTVANLTSKEFLERLKNDRYSWGTFQIHDQTIEFELPYPSGDLRKPVYRFEGTILNETTFHVTSSFRPIDGSDRTGKDMKFHFKKFSPKPDSTNNFIK